MPAKRGMRIKIAGKPCKITGFRNLSLLVRFDFDPDFVHAVHPVYSVEYPE